MRNRDPIHVAAKFGRGQSDNYNKTKMRDYIRTMLEDESILYDNTLIIEDGAGIMTVQVKRKKAAVSRNTLDDVTSVLEALEGHIETWVLSESVMNHPEILEA